jgi:hypothetical protein
MPSTSLYDHIYHVVIGMYHVADEMYSWTIPWVFVTLNGHNERTRRWL